MLVLTILIGYLASITSAYLILFCTYDSDCPDSEKIKWPLLFYIIEFIGCLIPIFNYGFAVINLIVILVILYNDAYIRSWLTKEY